MGQPGLQSVIPDTLEEDEGKKCIDFSLKNDLHAYSKPGIF